MAADLSGTVQGAGKPIAGSTVTLYAAGTGAPVQLAQGNCTDDIIVYRTLDLIIRSIQAVRQYLTD